MMRLHKVHTASTGNTPRDQENKPRIIKKISEVMEPTPKIASQTSRKTYPRMELES
jgi:hypothetical protein